jgi:DNA-directed RNA polymerase subunit RPC12/RpoP
MKKYRCAACGEHHESERSDEDAVAESKLLWGNIPMEDQVVICDDCFERGKAKALADYHDGQLRN